MTEATPNTLGPWPPSSDRVYGDGQPMRLGLCRRHGVRSRRQRIGADAHYLRPDLHPGVCHPRPVLVCPGHLRRDLRRRRRVADLQRHALPAPPGEDEREPPQVYGNNQIELAWTVVPILISVPRVPRRGHGPHTGGVAGEPAVKRRHTPSYGVRFSDARPASGRNPDGVGCVLLICIHALSHEKAAARICSIMGLPPSSRRCAAQPTAPPRRPNRFDR